MEFHGALSGTSAFCLIHYDSKRAIISSFDINHHFYADDTQIYMSLSVSNAKESLKKLCNGCVGLDERAKLKPFLTRQNFFFCDQSSAKTIPI